LYTRLADFAEDREVKKLFEKQLQACRAHSVELGNDLVRAAPDGAP